MLLEVQGKKAKEPNQGLAPTSLKGEKRNRVVKEK
jgi:hypothetical protein